MARKARLYIEGLAQLLKFTSHNRIHLFPEAVDIEYYLTYLNQACIRFEIQLHTYHLLSHEILLLLSPASQQSLSRFAQYLSQHYTRYFNQKYQETGTIWDGRYQSCSLDPRYYLFCHQLVDSYHQITAQHSYHANAPHLAHAPFAALQLTQHTEYTKLAQQQLDNADKNYHQLLARPLHKERIEHILTCLKQNKLLATPKFYQEIADKTNKVLQPKKVGRPKKRNLNQLFHLNRLQLSVLPLLKNYAYQEIRLSLLSAPVMPQTQRCATHPLFSHHSIEETQKIVLANKTMILREEGTAQLLRMLKEHRQIRLPCRLWYQGEMFKPALHNPRKLAQYTQIGIEALGYSSIEIELEQFLLQHQLFKNNQLDSLVQLRINTIGTAQELSDYRQALSEYYQPIAFLLSPEDRSLLAHLPEQLQHSKNPLLKHLEDPLPQLSQFLSSQSLKRFEQLTLALLKLDVPFVIAPSLLPANQYNHTFYEWYSPHLPVGEQLLCRGGRYDEIATSYLKQPVYATGCAFFIEPIVKLLQLSCQISHRPTTPHHLLIYPLTKDASIAAVELATKLRKTFNYLSIVSDFSYAKLSIKKQEFIKDNYHLLLLVEPEAVQHKMFTLIDNQANVQKKQLNVEKITRYLRLTFPLTASG